jgi:hypothetical protein
MPSDFWEEQADDGGFAWDDVESIRAVRGDDGWDIYVESDGEMIPVAEDMSDEEMEAEFWDDLYYWAMENEIDFDRDIEYAAE